MIEQMYYWCFSITLWNCGIVYGQTRDRRENFVRRAFLCGIGYLLLGAIINLLPISEIIVMRLLYRVMGFLVLIGFHYICWDTSWSVAIYDSIWAFMSWQLLYELWTGICVVGADIFAGNTYRNIIGSLIVFALGHIIMAYTIARWMPDGGAKRLGPRQLVSALLLFATFEIIGLSPGNYWT